MCDAVERYHIAKKLCVIVKYGKDTRYDHLAKNGGLVTHAGIEHCKVPVVSAETLESVFDEISKYEVIGIDEVQFFKDCVEISQRLACMGKVIICAGLDGDHQAKPFNRVLELVPLAEDVYKLKAVCMKCCEDASFTMRINQANNADIKDIGGVDKYAAVCRKCRWG
jgi:thymidine kinase